MHRLLANMHKTIVNALVELGYRLEESDENNTYNVSAKLRDESVYVDLDQIGGVDDYAMYDSSIAFTNESGTFLYIFSERTAECVKGDTEDMNQILRSIAKGNYRIQKDRLFGLFTRTYLTIDLSNGESYSLLKTK